MNKHALAYCFRGIIRYLDGDIKTANDYITKAARLSKRKLCRCCGSPLVRCKYSQKHAWLCTSCGLVIQGNRILQRCLVNSRRREAR